MYKYLKYKQKIKNKSKITLKYDLVENSIIY